MFHHTAHVLENDVVGYPDAFIEPPLGYYVNQQFAVQVAKADTHRFTLYNSDFLPGTDRFSPIGASRFNLMFARLPDWSGPIVVQWSPDEPALAQARRQAVVETLASAGLPVMAERVLIGPSPYPGGQRGRGRRSGWQTRSSVTRPRRRDSRCHRPNRHPWESAEMTIDTRRLQTARRGRPSVRSNLIRAGLAMLAGLGTGCATDASAAGSSGGPGPDFGSDRVGRPPGRPGDDLG